MGQEGRVRRRRTTQRVTMTDVARLAAMSPSTVSLYLRKPAAVSKPLGERIERAIETLGYVPNLVAGGLAAASSRVVGVVVPSVRNAFFADTVEALQQGLREAGFQLLVGSNEYDPADEEQLVRAALAWSPAAVVLTGLVHNRTTHQLLRRAGLPVIEVWELGQEPIDTLIGFSHHAVGSEMVRHLHGRGRRNVAFLGARMAIDRRASQRREGSMAAAGLLGLPPPPVVDHQGPASPEAGGEMLGRLLAEHPETDAACCSNDHVALGVLFECQRRGIAVPGRLAVMGFGDLPFARCCVPPLTTIRPPGLEIGRFAGEIILRRVRGEDAGPRIVDLGFTLVRRESA
jgi:LacI family gluconate utilization system Gnt-I transcriptional repressor